MCWLILFLLPLQLMALSLDEKIGQLFIAGVYSNKEDAISEGQNEHPIEVIEKLIQEHHIGGVLFKKRWNPLQVKTLAAHFQGLSAVPLFTCIDAEWGLSQRIAAAERFPKNLALGHVEDDHLLYLLGKEIARQCREIGLNFNFAPVVDVNTNPLNPVINDRSFGDDPDLVLRKAVSVMKGLQEGGVIACAKHFPGHGDTAVDSHTGLPILHHDWVRLERIEMVPFKALIDQGVFSVMAGHLLVPALDQEYPASLSKKTLTELLQNKLHFEGLIITDDLMMEAISKHYSPGEAAYLSFQAGCDLILTTHGAKVGIERIKQAVLAGEISEAEIDRHVNKILKAKEWVSLKRTCKPEDLKSTLYSKAISVKGPIEPVEGVIQIGGGESLFSPCCYLSQDSTALEQLRVKKEIENCGSIAIALFEMNRKSSDHYGISQSTINFVNALARDKKIIIILFGNLAAESLFPEVMAFILAHEDDEEAQKAAANYIKRKL